MANVVDRVVQHMDMGSSGIWFIVFGVLHVWQMWSIELSSTWIWVVLQWPILSLVKIVSSPRFFLYDEFNAVG